MRVARCEISRFELPLKAPMELRHLRLESRAGLVIQVEDELGNVGLGEISPLAGVSRESIEDALRQASETKKQLLAKASVKIDDFENWPELFPSIRMGFEMALLQLDSLRQQRPLFAPYFGRFESVVSVQALLAGRSEEEVLGATREAKASGHTFFKLKIGAASPQQEASLVWKVREIIGGQGTLRLDANRAWSIEQALEFAQLIAACEIAYIEEPFREADTRSWFRFFDETGIPIAVDESLFLALGMKERLDVLSWESGVRAAVLKPTLLGGFGTTFSLAKASIERGIVPVLSSSFESGLATQAIARFGAGLAAMISDSSAVGIDPYLRLAGDVLRSPIGFHEGKIEPAGQVAASELDWRKLQPAG